MAIPPEMLVGAVGGLFGIVYAGVLLSLRGWPSKILAFPFVVGAAGFVYYTASFFLGGPGPTAGVLETQTGIVIILILAFVWVFPTRPPLRSVDSAVVAFALAAALVGLFAWLFAREWLLDPASALTRQKLITNPHAYTLRIPFALALLLALRRSEALPPARRRGARIILSGWFYTHLAAPMAALVLFTAGATGAGPPWRPSLFANGIGNAPALLYIAYLATLAFCIVHQARRANWFPLGVAGLALGLALVTYFAPVDVSFAGDVFVALASVYAVVSLDALGTGGFPRRRATALGWLAGSAAFAQTVTTMFAVGGEDPYAIVFAAALGLVLGVAGVVGIVPQFRERLNLDRDPSTTRSRLDPYRTLLLQEIAAGTPRVNLAEKLRPLRASLGISDHEHAILEYATTDAPPTRLTARDLQPGQRFLDRYRVVRALGQGGLGVTHLCVDERVGRNVVIKTLRSDGGTVVLDGLLKEARAMGRVQHANVVTLLDADRVGDEAFLVMEHVEGGSLADRLRVGRLGPGEFTRLGDDVLAGLAAVHGAGLVHRDVKPSNILVTRAGQAKVADFGVAHISGFETTALAGPGNSAVGTVRYMSPEQARGRAVTTASDLYSAGLVLYEAWTGKPYRDVRPTESALELQMRVAATSGVEREIEGPVALGAWFRKALHPTPSERFASADEMARGLRNAVNGAGGAPGGL